MGEMSILVGSTIDRRRAGTSGNRQCRHTWLLGCAILGMLFLSACSFNSETTSVSGPPTPAGTATPQPPTGAYAFVRNGDLWSRQGDGSARPLTTFGLNGQIAAWGPIAWSPDQRHIAFVLRAPPIAPGATGPRPEQGTGSLYLVDLATQGVQQVQGGNGPLIVPLVGRHLAWLSATTLLATQYGSLYQITIAAQPTVTIVPGLKFIWEILTRGTTLFYSAVPDATADGQGTGQLRQRQGPDQLIPQSDTLVATLGPMTLPAQPCAAFLCPADLTAPVVPFAWDVSADGSRVAYQTTNPVLATPTPTSTRSPTPTTTLTPTTTPTVSATSTRAPVTPSAVSQTPTAATMPTAGPTAPTAGPVFALVTVKGDEIGGPQVLTALFSQPRIPILRIAPNGAAVALADGATSAVTPISVLLLKGGAASRALILPGSITNAVVAGLSWSPESTILTATVQSGTLHSEATAYQFALSGAGVALPLETNLQQFTWATD